ncbi:hypothetical protein C8J57DRAFT_1592449 [Mycena rebaudengoi]|nr:hypothetical protein C8J57DRAFT_1592449 [Mycena rebaudengoi]
MIFLQSIFGYLVVCILYKWSIDWSTSATAPPSLLNMLTSMFLTPGTVARDAAVSRAGRGADGLAAPDFIWREIKQRGMWASGMGGPCQLRGRGAARRRGANGNGHGNGGAVVEDADDEEHEQHGVVIRQRSSSVLAHGFGLPAGPRGHLDLGLDQTCFNGLRRHPMSDGVFLHALGRGEQQALRGRRLLMHLLR